MTPPNASSDPAFRQFAATFAWVSSLIGATALVVLVAVAHSGGSSGTAVLLGVGGLLLAFAMAPLAVLSGASAVLAGSRHAVAPLILGAAVAAWLSASLAGRAPFLP